MTYIRDKRRTSGRNAGRITAFSDPPTVLSTASAVGRKEHEGPLSAYFDIHDPSDRYGQDTFEKAESEMQRAAINLALSKAGLRPEEVDAVFAGDLMNQCTGSSYALSSFGIPYFGLYGACSTAALALMLAAMTVDAGYFRTTLAVSSSHNSTAERQFRFPLEYGSQRSPTAQWTATAAGAFVVGRRSVSFPGDLPEGGRGVMRISEVLPGRIIDKGITDSANMGAAMAPAAADTLTEYFMRNRRSPSDFDLILTGDLGLEGHAICKELTAKEGLVLGDRFTDCGILLYDGKTQDTHSGGSGCGCSASVAAGYVAHGFRTGRFKNVLLVGTGALMSPMSVMQGQSIAGIAHLVRFVGV